MRATPPTATHLRDVRAQVAWWSPTLAIAFLGLVGGTGSLLTGQSIAVTICTFAIAVIGASGGIREHQAFRRGWRHGYESAIRTALEYQAGRTPDLEVRAAVHGDPVPEPWEKHTPPMVARRAS